MLIRVVHWPFARLMVLIILEQTAEKSYGPLKDPCEVVNHVLGVVTYGGKAT